MSPIANFEFNIAKGRWAQWAITDATKFGMILLKVAEADSAMKDRDTLAAVVANSTEANFTDYARKTGLTGTLTVDDTNDRAELSLGDKTWTGAGGATNNNLVKLITYYEISASDAGRVPLTAHDFVVTTNDTDLIATEQSGFTVRAT